MKSEICFDSGKFAGGAKHLQDQCTVVIYPPKVCQHDQLSREFGKNFGVTPSTAHKFIHFLNEKRPSILTHHFINTQTLENQKCIVVLCIHHQILQDYSRYRNFSRTPKPALIIIPKNLWIFLERQHMKSKNAF